MSPRTPYAKRTDIEKIASQWKKANGLHFRNESSASIVRAATAAEIAANLAIRKEFLSKSKLSADFVDGLLIWANGIAGKIDRLLIPLTKEQKYHGAIKKLKDISRRINKKRNSVAHSGEFCNPTESEAILRDARKFIETLLHIYEPNFVLKQQARK